MTGEILEWFDGPVAARLLAVLGHFCWQGAAVWAAAVLVGRGLAGRSAGVRYRAELTAFGLLCMCPAVTWGVSGSDGGGGSILRGEAHAKPQAVAPSGESIPTLPAGGGGSPAEPAVLPSAPSVGEVVAGSPVPRLSAWLLGLYAAGVSVGAVRLLIGAAGVAALKRSLTPVPDDVRGRVDALAGRLGLRRVPRAGFSKWARVPCAAGWVRPAVVLPLAWAGRVPPDVLDAALAHELAHLRGGDVWVNLVQRLAETVLFYHPAVWLLSGRVRSARELCRDADAARALGDPAAVARGLEFAASYAAPPRRRGALFCSPFGEGSMPVLSRVNALLGGPPVRRSPATSALPAAVVLSLPVLWWAGAAWAAGDPPVGTDPPASAVAEITETGGETPANLSSDAPPAGPGESDGPGEFAGEIVVPPVAGPGQYEIRAWDQGFGFDTLGGPGAPRQLSFYGDTVGAVLTQFLTVEDVLRLTTPAERAEAVRLLKAPDDGLGEFPPTAVRVLADVMEGRTRPAEPKSRSLPVPAADGDSGGAEPPREHPVALETAGGTVRLSYSAGMRGWLFHRPLAPADLPADFAERAFAATVLKRAAEGERPPAEVLMFWVRAGIADAAARVRAADPRAALPVAPAPTVRPAFSGEPWREGEIPYRVTNGGRSLTLWRMIDWPELLGLLTTGERTEVADRLARSTDPAEEMPEAIARLIALLRGTIPPPNVAAGGRFLATGGVPGEERSRQYSFVAAPASGDLWFDFDAQVGWQFWRRSLPEDLPSGQAAFLFENTVLPTVRAGEEMPAFVLEFWTPAVPDAAARVAAARDKG